ncbi:MAG: ABC transporter permease [Gemmatimonadetes bacterium]|nr:ABC transporter permease [Gemmatimonadota bacterium]
MRLALRESARSFGRAPLLSALSVVTIGFSLFAFGLFGLVALNIRNTVRLIEERVEIRAFLIDGTPVDVAAVAVGDIGSFPEVARAEFVSKEQALTLARRELREFREEFDASVLPASIDVRLKDGFRDPQTVNAVAARLRSYPFVDEVRYGDEWVEKVYRLRNIATITGLVLGLAFAAVSVIIIGATIRMTVLARSREIAIMRMVGATDSFIRSPFLIEGFAKGILGGAMALLLTWGAHRLFTQMVLETQFFSPRVAVAGVLVGGLIGALGSALSVGRHLREVT